MGVWDHLNTGNYGLAPRKWTEQLEQIRALPETPDEETPR